MSFEPLRYGALGSASSSYTTDEQRTSSRRLRPTEAADSEANRSSRRFNRLSIEQRQDIINFLRSL